MTIKRRKVVASLNPQQFADLEALMEEDNQDNFTFYVVYLIQQEKKRREGDRNKKSVGRPKKEEGEELYYPNPDKNATFPMTEPELIGYYGIRKEAMPPLPRPYSTEELKKWDM